MNLICKRGKMYNKKFDRIYLFSPSLGTIDDCPFEKLPRNVEELCVLNQIFFSVPYLYMDFNKLVHLARPTLKPNSVNAYATSLRVAAARARAAAARRILSTSAREPLRRKRRSQ